MKSKVIREVLSYAKIVVIALLIAFFINNVIIINATVPTGSMENTIMPDDRIIGLRLTYKLSEPERGDIIIFKYPVHENEKFIKRIIGLPGEKVEIKEGKIYIDDSKVPLVEDYLKEEWTVHNDGYVFYVPEDSYFVMGDNRNSSSDARFWAQKALNEGVAKNEKEAQNYVYVNEGKILGKAYFRYWPSLKMLN